MAADFQGKMARGAVWMLMFKWVERGLGLLSSLILVRLLSPSDFGIVAMAMSFIVMAELLNSFSFDVVLIQNQSATANHYNTAWTANLLLNGTITLIMVGLAIPIADFYNQPALLPLVCLLALGPLLSGLENIGIVAFRKELDFRKEFLFQVSRKVIGFCVAIPLAFWLRSYWALVIGTLAAKLAGTLLSYWAHPFRPRFALTEVASLFRFSRWLLLNNLVNFLKIRSFDFILGRFFGPGPLGVYNVCGEFANLPSNELGAPVNRALLPGFAKMSGDKEGLKRSFTNASGIVALIAVPAGAGLFAVAPYLVPVLLGQKWLAGVPVMEVLSLNSALLVFHGAIVTALLAVGLPFVATSINAVYVVVMLSTMFALAGRFSALGAAFAELTACVLTTPLYLFMIRKHFGVPIKNFFRVTMRPVLASIGMILVVRWLLPEYQTTMHTAVSGAWLASGVAAGALAYAAAMAALWTGMGRPAGAERQVLEKARDRMPSWVPVFGRGVKAGR